MTDPTPDIVEWEAKLHANDWRYWAANIPLFAKRLPRLRLIRGDTWAGRLVDDVIEHIKAAQGEDVAVLARDRLMAAWRMGAHD